MTIYHTKTQEDYDALMVELEEQGVKWVGGHLPTEQNKWGAYKEYTCVKIIDKKMCYSDEQHFKMTSEPIIEYTATQPDPVNHPSHYKQGKQEVIEIIEEVTPNYPVGVGYHVGNAIKYILRAPFKGRMKQDLEKAVWYLNRAIGRLDDE